MARRKAATAVTGTERMSGSLILQHKRAVMVAQAAKDEAGDKLKQALTQAKADGVDMVAFKAAEKLCGLDPARARLLYLNTGAIFEAMAPGVIGNKDLFDAVDPASKAERDELEYAEIEIRGFAAGRKGKTSKSDHRYDAGTMQAQAYERGWMRGVDAAFEEPEEGETVANDPEGKFEAAHLGSAAVN
ncbi:MAG: hypothetical protein ACRYGR_00685 [Janthinobacterium lividum]